MTGQSGKSKSRDCEEEPVPFLTSQRWIVAYMGFLYGIVIILLRVNINIALVCMVKTEETTEEGVLRNSSAYSNGTSYEETTVQIQPLSDVSCQEIARAKSNTENAEFTWSKDLQSWILSAYYYGYMLTQVAGGWMAKRLGGKRVISAGTFVCALGTLLTPSLTRVHVSAIIVIRFILGFTAGMTMPGYYCLFGVWAPPLERSRMVSTIVVGQSLGTMVTYSTSGVLCSSGFDNGWGSIFYIHGAVAMVFLVMWQYLIASSPGEHPRITEAERRYLAREIRAPTKEERQQGIPWRDILTSIPVLSTFIAHVCDTWTFYILLICLPRFMNEVLKFDIETNGLFSSLPFITMVTGVLFGSNMADLVITKQWISTTRTRRCWQIVAFVGIAVFIVVVGFITCDKRGVAILCLCVCTFFVGLSHAGGHLCSPVDLAPQYASIIFSISNTIATIPGFVTPVAVARLTPNGTREEWRTVFYMSAGFAVFGAAVYGAFARGERQPWADTTIEMSVDIEDPLPEARPFLSDKPHSAVCKNGDSNKAHAEDKC